MSLLCHYFLLKWLHIPFCFGYHTMWHIIVSGNSTFITLYYNNVIGIGGRFVGEQKADLLATLYDVGGIIGELLMIIKLLTLSLSLSLSLSLMLFQIEGSIFTGGLSDILNARAISCVIMMYLAVPTVSVCVYILIE